MEKPGQPFVIKAIQNSDASDFYKSEYRPKSRIDAGIADMMTYLLQDVFTEGTAMSAPAWGFDRPAAGKTGTTNDYRDSWFVGYTPQLTSLVWVGMDQGLIQEALKDASKDKNEVMKSSEKTAAKKTPKKIKLTGAVAALPIWAQFMKQALQYEPALPFSDSDQLQDMRLDRHSGQKAESSCSESQVVLEKVILGREPKKSSCLSDYPKDVD